MRFIADLSISLCDCLTAKYEGATINIGQLSLAFGEVDLNALLLGFLPITYFRFLLCTEKAKKPFSSDGVTHLI